MKCLEKDRTRRYETANGLAHDILCHLNNEPVLARPPSKLYRFQKLVRRNKLVFAAAAVVSGVLVLGVIVSSWQAVRATHAKREALTAQANEAKLRQQAQAEELAARQRAYASDMSLPSKRWMETTLVARWTCSTGSVRSPAKETCAGGNGVTSGNNAAAMPCSPSASNPARSIRWPFPPTATGWRWASGISKGGLSVWDLRTRQELIRLAESEEYVRAAFSPTEPLLAFTSFTVSASGQGRSTLRLWNTETRQMVAEFPLDNECMGLAFSKDGRTLVTSTSSGMEGRITLWRMPEGTKLASYPSEQVQLSSGTGFAATPDLSLAAYGLRSGRFASLICATARSFGRQRHPKSTSLPWHFHPTAKPWLRLPDSPNRTSVYGMWPLARKSGGWKATDPV